MRVLGIDPGLDGGWCLFEDEAPVQAGGFPVVSVGSRKRRDYIWGEMLTLLRELKPDLVIIEMVTRPGRLVRMQARVQGWFEGMGIPVVTVTPVTWVRHHDLIGTEKKAKVALAEAKYPAVAAHFRKTRGGINDGPADAALIGGWAIETGVDMPTVPG